MPEFDETNRGVLFKNDRKTGKQPDHRGTLNVGGVEYEIACWEKTGRKGPFLSLSVKPKEGAPQRSAEQPRRVSDEDEIPF